eukprot:TRINITY_DN6039_c1_g1_i2.p1 TRINITY_DN6039_c1_g1~~TRINITY_DN6039_c1_g1_i2.p1  ORF type:complete len:334 (-),score=49.70 TRINITY_DN6039_c1_g1_i2:361-1362(-)
MSHTDEDNAAAKYLRSKVGAVYRDASLSPQEKSRRIQIIMCENFHSHASAGRAVARHCTNNHTLEVHYHDAARTKLGCKHYARACTMRCSTCKKFYVCRRCHDDAEDHLMNRYEVQEVKCMRCGLVQSSSNCCMSTKCKGAPFARYYCSVCNFWDDDESKEIYHCSKCVICRVGRGIGTDRQHCDTCGCCYPIEHFRDHHCIPKQLQVGTASCTPLCLKSLSLLVQLPCLQPVPLHQCQHGAHHPLRPRHPRGVHAALAPTGSTATLVAAATRLSTSGTTTAFPSNFSPIALSATSSSSPVSAWCSSPTAATPSTRSACGRCSRPASTSVPCA